MIGYRCSTLAGDSDYKSYIVCSVNTVTGIETQYNNVSMYQCFRNNTSNSPIQIGEYVTNCSWLFENCANLNQPITIPNRVTNCYAMLERCSEFNCVVTMPDTVKDCARMFGSSNFNQPITISNATISCHSTFQNSAFNQDIIIPESVTNAYAMLAYCVMFAKNVYVKGKTYRNISAGTLFHNCNNAKRKNIWFNSILNNRFNNTNQFTGAIVFSDSTHNVVWTTMTNGFYNAVFNVYCYYNYSG